VKRSDFASDLDGNGPAKEKGKGLWDGIASEQDRMARKRLPWIWDLQKIHKVKYMGGTSQQQPGLDSTNEYINAYLPRHPWPIILLSVHASMREEFGLERHGSGSGSGHSIKSQRGSFPGVSGIPLVLFDGSSLLIFWFLGWKRWSRMHLTRD